MSDSWDFSLNYVIYTATGAVMLTMLNKSFDGYLVQVLVFPGSAVPAQATW